jgi:hypothetical protein
MAWCKECGEKWAQDASGRCRSCRRMYEATLRVRAALRMIDYERQHEPEPTREPLRTVAYDGQVFEVMWDGSTGRTA